MVSFLPMSRWLAASALALTCTACGDDTTVDSADLTDAAVSEDGAVVAPENRDADQQRQALFASLLLGVQQIENFSGISKMRGAVDDNSTPPSYTVTYSGCADGAVEGQICVDDGEQRIAILGETIQIIQGLTQTYRLDGYSADGEFTLSGTMAVDVTVTVDPEAETSQISGTAQGTLTVSGLLEGEFAFDLTIAGGRNYTHDATTLVTVAGTMTRDGQATPVEGGFARE